MHIQDPINKIANTTLGLTNRVEICVIDSLRSYDFNINRSEQPQVVERPNLPSLVVGEGGITQNGLTEQTKRKLKNRYEIIRHDRYVQVKELMGYMGIKADEYDLFKVEHKDTEVGTNFVNCGASDPIDISGIVYTSDDEFFTPIGCDTSYSTTSQITSGGKWEELYQTARSIGNTEETKTLSWEFNQDINTFYKMKLRFADYWEAVRNFDIYINGWNRKEEFSIIGRAGKTFARTDIDFRVPVNTNKIKLDIIGSSHLNAVEIYRLDKGDVKFTEANRNDNVTNKDIFLFLNKDIYVSEQNLKRKFLEIQETTLKSRNLFFL